MDNKQSIPMRVKHFIFPEETEDLFKKVEDYNNYANYSLDMSFSSRSVLNALKDVTNMLSDPICSSAVKCVMQTAFQPNNDGKLFVLNTPYEAISQELKRYLNNYSKIEKDIGKRLKKGEINEREAKKEIEQKIFSGKEWNKEKTKLATMLYEADEELTEYADDRLDEIYCKSANYQNYEAETHYSRDLGTVLLAVGMTAVHTNKKTLDKVTDVAWNKSGIQNSIKNTIKYTVPKYVERGKMYNEIGRKAINLVTGRNSRYTQNALQYLMWGTSDEAKWEQMMDLRKKGIEVKKGWIATLDKHTRDTHKELDGQTEDVEKPFRVKGYKIMYPRQNSAPPEMICNCRCDVTYEYPEYSTTEFARRENIKEDGEDRRIIPYMTYEEWEDYKYGEYD